MITRLMFVVASIATSRGPRPLHGTCRATSATRETHVKAQHKHQSWRACTSCTILVAAKSPRTSACEVASAGQKIALEPKAEATALHDSRTTSVSSNSTVDSGHDEPRRHI